MTDEWFYARGKEKVGPVTAAQLKQLARTGGLTRNSMVWKAGMPKWVQAGQVGGLFPEAPQQAATASAPPPLPDEQPDGAAAAVPTPDDLKLPVVGMFVVSGLALFFGLMGVVGADSPVVRVLQAVGIAHNLFALALVVGVVRLRGYAVAALSPWAVMTCWLWHWLSNVTHGVPLLGMVLAISAGVWAFLVLRRLEVRRAFDADPPLPPLFSWGGSVQAAGYEIDPATRFPWPLSERDAPNLNLRAGNVAIIGITALALLLFCTDAAILGLWLLGVVALFSVFWIRLQWGLPLHGRWVPTDGQRGWVEFLSGGIYKQEDGKVGTFTLLKNQRFIDIVVSGHLVDSWKILSWGDATLEVQDMAGQARGFKKGKTLEEKQANPFRRERAAHLPNSWTPIDGSGEWVQFTEDGAVVFSDGTAGRYTVSGEEPDEVIQVKMSGGSAKEFRVLSLSRSQLVIEEGAVARTYRPAGRKKSGHGGAVNPTPGVGEQGGHADPASEGEGPGLGGVLSSAWNWLSGKEPCLTCKSRNTELLGRKETKRWQEVKTDSLESGPGYTKQAVFNCSVYEESYRCKECGHQWLLQRRVDSKA